MYVYVDVFTALIWNGEGSEKSLEAQLVVLYEHVLKDLFYLTHTHIRPYVRSYKLIVA